MNYLNFLYVLKYELNTSNKETPKHNNLMNCMSHKRLIPHMLMQSLKCLKMFELRNDSRQIFNILSYIYYCFYQEIKSYLRYNSGEGRMGLNVIK